MRRLSRLCGCLASVLLALPAAPVRGQDGGPEGRESRYVPIPFQGNFEGLFKDRLQSARDDESLRRLLSQIENNPGKYNVDPELLNRLDPATRSLVRDMAKKHQEGKGLTPAQIEGLKKSLDKLRSAKGETSRPAPKLGQPAPAKPAPQRQNSQPERDPLDRLMRDLARRTEGTELADWLRDSPAVQKGLTDLRNLADFENNPSIWNLGELPEHLRLTGKLDLRLGEGLLDRFRNISVPRLPQVNWPRINLGRWNVPSVPLPNLGAPGGGNIGAIVVWALVLGIGVVVFWQILRNWNVQKRRRPARATPGPWPVDPGQVATRAQLIQAFDYLALLLLGDQARTWNHRTIARKMTAQPALVSEAQRQAPQELAGLYEQARYTAGAEALSAPEQLAARRHLLLLSQAAAA